MFTYWRKITVFYVSMFLFFFSFFPRFHEQEISAQTNADWYMAGANPERTSWVSGDVSSVTGISWYRPIEAFIDAQTQIVTGSSFNHIYLSTAKGLLVFNPLTGDLAWRFDTELPLGQSSTVVGNRVYVSGMDRRVYALDDLGTSYSLVWTWEGAKAGFSANPLVIKDSNTSNQTRIFIGDRAGYFYALNDSGQQVWKYPSNENSERSSLESIMQSAAYDGNGVV